MPTSDTASSPGAEIVEAPPPPPAPIPLDPALQPGMPPPPDPGEVPVLVESDPVAVLFGEEVEPGEAGADVGTGTGTDPGTGTGTDGGAGVHVSTNVRFEPSDANPRKPEGVAAPVGASERAAGRDGGENTAAGEGVTVTTRIERTANGVIVTVNAVFVNK